MPDLLVGATVKAQDFPAAVTVRDLTVQNDISPDAYVTGSPVVDLTFTAPTSGRVLVVVGGGVRTVSGDGRVALIPEVYEGTDATGTPVLEAAPGSGIDQSHGFVNPDTFTAFFLANRARKLSGLTPGATHYARVMQRVFPISGVADIGARDLAVVPLT